MTNELTLNQIITLEDELNSIFDKRAELENEEEPNKNLISECTIRYNEVKTICRLLGYNVEREVRTNGRVFLVKR